MTDTPTRKSILFEYPLNDRMRTLLRLEDVFERMMFFRSGDSNHHHVSAVAMLFDLLDISNRADLRTDLTAEVDGQIAALTAFRNLPGVATETLDLLLAELDRCRTDLAQMENKFGATISENEWLMAVRSRILIAGGAADYDMPSFWAWQNMTPEARRQDIDTWLTPFKPLRSALRITMRLLRESGNWQTLDASDGTFQHSLGGESYELVRLKVDSPLGAIPDISANKYLLWIRFNAMDRHNRPEAINQPVPFQLNLCSLR
ncbi:MAG: cell division protein ZapD [Burkholderiaceae bacterium]